jgi:hypothetical protein
MVRRGAVSGAGALSRDGVRWARRLRLGIDAPMSSAFRAFSTLAGNAKVRAVAGARG